MTIDSSTKQQPSTKTEYFKFDGTAGEFFGIWFVNNTLTFLTLGIYSVWAKVRTLQYFYGNTSLSGGYFQFTANPLRIFRSRVIAVLLLVLYVVAEKLNSLTANIVYGAFIVGFILGAPVLSVYVTSFKLRYSEWRGISFKFRKDFKGAYRVYLAPSIIFALLVAALMLPERMSEKTELDDQGSSIQVSETLERGDEAPIEEVFEDEKGKGEGEQDMDETYYDASMVESESESESDSDGLESEKSFVMYIPALFFLVLFIVLIPYFDFISIRYLARNAMLGTARFSFDASLKDFYKIYAVALLVIIGLIAAWSLQLSGVVSVVWLMVLATIVLFPFLRAYLKSRRYNLILSHTLIHGRHRLQASTTVAQTFWLIMSNSIMVAITFGFMTPWAKVRTAKYFIENASVLVDGDLDGFVHEQLEESSALGEELADVFDLELL